MRLKFAFALAAALAGWMASAKPAQASHCGACAFPEQTLGAEQCCVPQVRYRVCYQTIVEDQTQTCYRQVFHTVMKECRSTSWSPVYEQCYRTVNYTVQRPVYENYDVVRKYVVCRPVYEQHVRTGATRCKSRYGRNIRFRSTIALTSLCMNNTCARSATRCKGRCGRSIRFRNTIAPPSRCTSNTCRTQCYTVWCKGRCGKSTQFRNTIALTSRSMSSTSARSASTVRKQVCAGISGATKYYCTSPPLSTNNTCTQRDRSLLSDRDRATDDDVQDLHAGAGVDGEMCHRRNGLLESRIDLLPRSDRQQMLPHARDMRVRSLHLHVALLPPAK